MKKPTTLVAFTTLTLLALSTTAASASTWDASASLGAFDDKVALGLPQGSFRIIAADETGTSTEARLTIDSRLDTVIELPDGSSMATYVGTWNGAAATISRGDGQLFVETDEPDGFTNEAIARFDAAARASFPASVTLPSFGADADFGPTSTLVLVSRLRSSVTFPDEAPATLYRATFDGAAAVATRSIGGLDISVTKEDGVHVISLSEGSSATAHTHVAAASGATTQRRRRSMSYGFEGDVEHGDEPPAAMSLADPLAPLKIHIFLHDELRSSRVRDIHAGYVAWWLRDMETTILPEDISIDIVYLQPISGISDLAYGSSSSLAAWSAAADRYVTSRGIKRTWKNKFLLVTADHPAKGKLGQSIPAIGIATAALSGPYNVIAHELGHLFGADHVHSEWRVSGWWPCRTNMYPDDTPLLANCYAYTAANIAVMQTYVELKGYLPPYMAEAPDSP